MRTVLGLVRVGALAGLAVVGVAASAQSAPTTETVPPQYVGVQTRVPGVFVTPIPNIPFTAKTQISSTRVLPDGATEMRKTETNIARNSQGEIYNEGRRMMPVNFKGTAPLVSSHIYDPQTRLSTVWQPGNNVARAVTLDPRQMRERKPFSVPAPGAVDADLGESTMSGVTVRGLRRTRTINPVAGGTMKPINVVDEYWYSEDLHLVMLEKHDDPRTGEQIVAITDVHRGEPDAKVFALPEGYRTVDLTPDRAALTPRDHPVTQASPAVR
jgi:hypothetical protein